MKKHPYFSCYITSISYCSNQRTSNRFKLLLLLLQVFTVQEFFGCYECLYQHTIHGNSSCLLYPILIIHGNRKNGFSGALCCRRCLEHCCRTCASEIVVARIIVESSVADALSNLSSSIGPIITLSQIHLKHCLQAFTSSDANFVIAFNCHK